MDDNFEEENLLEDLKYVAATKNGRSFLWWLLSMSGIYHDNYNQDSGLMKYQAGKRALGLEVLNLMDECDPELIYKIAKEKNNGKRK